jgi:hypothetical protein
MTIWRGDNQPQGSLIDILDKVLDKGLVVAGDIRVEVANVELLCIKVRLLVCSIDKAQEIGLDWWKHDSFLSSSAESGTAELRERIEALEQQLALAQGADPASKDPPGRPRTRSRRRDRSQANPEE